LPEKIYIIGKLVTIVNTLATNNIVHGDIKPENLYYSTRKLTLLDTGFSCMASKCPKKIVSTKNFVAPEQFSEIVDPLKLDIYAVGKTIYTIVTNKLYDKTKAEGRFKSSGGTDGLWNLLARMIALDPKDRPSPGEAYTEVNKLIDEAALLKRKTCFGEFCSRWFGSGRRTTRKNYRKGARRHNRRQTKKRFKKV